MESESAGPGLALREVGVFPVSMVGTIIFMVVVGKHSTFLLIVVQWEIPTFAPTYRDAGDIQ